MGTALTRQDLLNAASTERFIICAGSEQELWVCCDDIAKMDRFNTIAWIARGEFKGVSKVIAFDLSKGTSRDASKEIAVDVMSRWAHEGEPLTEWQVEYIELNVSVQAANSFAREAA